MRISKVMWMMAVLSSVVISGCGNGKQDSGDIKEEIVPGYEYTISSEVYSKDEISIEYPQISGLNNSAEKSWNYLIRETMLKDIDELTSEDKYEIKYDIKTRTDDFISILASGYRFNEGAPYPYNFVRTYNIEIPKGASRRLGTTGKVKEYAEKIFKGEGYKLENDIFEDAFKDYISQTYSSAEEIAQVLSKYDFVYDDSSSIPNGFSYYDDEKLVICMEVPHAVGDYIKIVMD